jgi:DNA replication and repair protein RecF
LLGLEVDIRYQPGWDADVGLATVLREQLDKDLQRGFTSMGPHRADIKLKHAGKMVQTLFSRGQQKLLICAMTLAQMRVLGQGCLILVDDLPAELDPQKRQVLMGALRSTGAQIMVTATESGLIQVDDWPERKMFHVEHGKVREVI